MSVFLDIVSSYLEYSHHFYSLLIKINYFEIKQTLTHSPVKYSKNVLTPLLSVNDVTAVLSAASRKLCKQNLEAAA